MSKSWLESVIPAKIVSSIPASRFFERVLDTKFQQTSSCSCYSSVFSFTLFPLANNALSHLPVQSIQKILPRQMHQKWTPDFHDKYGNAVLASGATFCVARWTCTATQIGIEGNLPPAGRVTPKEWRNQKSHQLGRLSQNQLIIDVK
ncbi:cytochrome c oxidase subunit 7B, mitochondrial-like [Pteronotus mesoamericanus]|uniref:cytochrome c oxidase subunit 7B, mitochondrial-like n=1 Tax=Pteronotus mesoamericanus TaxID=1884717 RepID=UPI0023ED8FE4|nr:cytochrome c oxidase subunit 7B, mitochondrial-like [Pteronotus parnellii mesoamericanus]